MRSLAIVVAAIPFAATFPDMPPADTWGLNVADWNGDDRPDILMINHRDGQHDATRLPDWHDILLVSDGDNWEIGIELPYADRHDCTPLQADDGGLLDFFCAVGSSQTTPNDGLGPNELWLQQDDGWVEAARAWGIDDPVSRGRFVATVDWNGDGRDDLFVGTAPRDDIEVHSSVWINHATFFEPVPVERWGTNCAVPWKGGVVVCDVGPILGTSTWWLRPGQPPFRIGSFIAAASTEDKLVLVSDNYLTVNGARINLPRPASGRPVATDGSTVYVIPQACSHPDMLVDIATRTVRDVVQPPGCTSAVEYLGDGRVVVTRRNLDGTPNPPMVYRP